MVVLSPKHPDMAGGEGEIERLREERLNELLSASLASKSVRRARKVSDG
jgi:hypothetical protein